MNNNSFLHGHSKMRPRARLIGLIGDELISDEPVAIVELVKNSYDADAKKVSVTFEGKNPEKPDRILVTDDGTGMDLKTVISGWLEPGTIFKREREKSPNGRLYQGAKGIGRFAAARLAESLLLETKKRDDSQGVLVLLEWGKFDDNSYLDEINIEYETSRLKDLKQGTRLTLEGLRKTWSENDFEELHARLSRLISPFEDIKEFEIHLNIPSYPQLSGLVTPPELIVKPKYSLTGELDSEGKFSGKWLLDGYEVGEDITKRIGGKLSAPICGPFEVDIRGWDRDRDGLEPIKERLNMSIQEIRGTLNTYCGVSIYRDGFRVYPYGQKGNDWLNLDIRSRLNPVKHMANNQIVAAIRISRQGNQKLIDRSTREGMVLNYEHKALENWFIKLLSIMEEKRYNVRPRRESSGHIEPLFEAFEITPTVQLARKELGTKHPVTISISDVEKQLKKGIESIQEVFSSLLLSAGLGHMVDIVIHEIGSPLGKINRQLVIMENQLIKALSQDIFKNIKPMLDSILGWLEQIHNLRDRLEPQTPAKRGRATTFDVSEEIKNNFELYQALLTKQNIKWEIESPEKPVIVKMSRASLSQIVVNLIDNSIYWLILDKSAGKGGNILVKIESIAKGFRFLFCDDGPGINEEDSTSIFEAYFTKKPNGMGLGLYIARLIIEPYGKLIYHPKGALSGACFEANFEKGVSK